MTERINSTLVFDTMYVSKRECFIFRIDRIRKMQKKKKAKSNVSSVAILLLVICTVIGMCVFAGYKMKSVKNNHLVSINNEQTSKDITSNSTKENGSSKTGNDNTWCLVLVNKWNPISSDINIKTTKLSNGERINTRVYPYLQEMFDAARKDGVYPIVASGFRTNKEQTEIYNEKIEDYKKEGLSEAQAKKEAEYWVAIPGTSEHELGLAVDINADGVHSKGTDVYEWLKENAHLYGFINRYPAEKVAITGVANEPWHYRYVGVEVATEIYNQGVCLEEYLGKVN